MKIIKILLLVISLVMIVSGAVFAADWYVSSDSDGEGTKDDPFDDPQRAMDAAAAGDVIHVVQGEYYGKMKVGYVVVDKRGLTLVGGYKDKTFTERNPFKYPTFIKQAPVSKSSTFDGGYIRVKEKSGYVDHWSTTVDGFWFDRKDQNSYAPLNASPDKCPGCIAVPLGSNTKPVIVFENPDCHIRNCVFMNTALYAIRLTGDGSSAENNLFLNVNYCGIDIFGKGEKLGKGYSFQKILIKNNTFVSAWNAVSLERAAGSFIIQGGGADITVTDNIFHLSNGNSASMGYAIKDERNFNADKWVHFLRNSISQMRGGIASIYMTDLTASINFDKVKDLRDSPWEAKQNDEENPFFKFDKEWFERYMKAIPKDDPSSKKVNMDDFNKMCQALGIPINQGSINLGGAFLGTFYPIDHVKTGAFFKTDNEKLKSRGLQADGPFPIIKGALVADTGSSTTTGEDGTAVPAKDYKDTDYNTLWTSGETMIDQPVKFKAYYMGTDSNYYAMSGSKNVYYLKDADKNTHIIIQVRKVEEMTSKEYPFKGYIKKGSEAENYINKKARKAATNKKEMSENAFIIYGVVRKAGEKVNMGLGPQIIIEIDTITADE